MTHNLLPTLILKGTRRLETTLPFLLIVAFFLIGTTWSYAQEKELQGWDKAKFGMTILELQKTYGDRLSEVNSYPNPDQEKLYELVGGFSGAKINEYKIEGIPFNVNFLFSTQTKRLANIQFFHHKKGFEGRYIEESCLKIGTALKRKYGLPSIEKKKICSTESKTPFLGNPMDETTFCGANLRLDFRNGRAILWSFNSSLVTRNQDFSAQCSIYYGTTGPKNEGGTETEKNL